MVGVFWIYEGEVYHKAVSVDDITPINGFIDSDLAHYEVWDEIQRKNPAFYLYEYEEIPRGRVVYDTVKKYYVVYANSTIIKSPIHRKRIAETFEVDRNRIKFFEDEHYKLEQKEH